MAHDINLTPTASFLDIRRAAHPSDGVASNHAPLPARTWGSAPDCVAGALLIHGLGAHSGWFEALGRRLKVRRVFALSYDQVGFGKRRNEVFSSRKQWLDDLFVAYDQMKGMIGDKPLYIMGNSMGGLVALRAVSALNIKPAGLVLFSPGFEGHPRTFSIPYRVKALVQALLKPESEIALPYGVDQVTSQEGVRNWLLNDPERRFVLPAGMLLELLKLTREVAPKSRKIPCPVLMMHAGVDQIVDTSVNKKIFQAMHCPEKVEREYETAWHDLMFDPIIDEVTNEVIRWISKTANVAPDKLRLV